VIGTPGGRTIINTTLQLILNMVDFDMDIEQAVAAPRMHHQWLPDRIRLEADAVSPDVVQALEELGHAVQMGGRQGSANSIGVNPRTGVRMGAPDPRSADAGAVGSAAPGGAR
jgi:gamma-glutamyltranspeptidase/glutathione hydrolase